MMDEIVKSNLPEINYNKEQIDLIKSMFAKGATNDELGLLMHMSKTYNLDVLTRKIWLVKFANNPAQIYAGRDGFLDIAHRSGMFNGMESGTRIVDGKLKGWAIVYRKDMQFPFKVEVDLEEYTTNQALWKTKPKTMLQKVAESQCLRKAFSISGLYSPEEMSQYECEVQNIKYKTLSTEPTAAPKIDPEASKTNKTTDTNVKYNPDTYLINGGKHKGELMKDTSASYILWNMNQITTGKYDPSKYGIDTTAYLKMLSACLTIAENREASRDNPDTDTSDVEDITEAEFEELQEEFPIQQETLIK